MQSGGSPLLELPGSTVVTFVAAVVPASPPVDGAPEDSLPGPPLVLTPVVGAPPLLPVSLVLAAVTLVPGVVPGVAALELSPSSPPPQASARGARERRRIAVRRMAREVITAHGRASSLSVHGNAAASSFVSRALRVGRAAAASLA